MKIKVIAAVAAVRISTFLLRLIGRGGTSLPGKAALFINRDMLSFLSKDVKTIIVTGTNGKTTTSRILGQMLKQSGRSYFANSSGANLISGITAVFALNCKWNGIKKYDYAVIECDEAAFKTVAGMIKPAVVVITNLFRDQLDRYGEITHTLTSLRTGILSSPGSTLIINADDSLSYSLALDTPNKTLLFGINSPPHGADTDFVSDAPYCIRCKGKYTYSYRVFAHLGSFKCEQCGYKRAEPDYSADSIVIGPSGSSSKFTCSDGEFTVDIALPGAYNVYNALAAFTAASHIGIKKDVIISSLSSFTSGFGRMEELVLDDVVLKIILVKNPAGLNQVINHLTANALAGILVMILNDKHADGTDVSWIWDANFEKLAASSSLFTKIIFSGTRAGDLDLRFKYALKESTGLKTEVITDYEDVIKEAILNNGKKQPVYVLPTYTAMFEFRNRISRLYKIRKFWE